MDKLDLQKKLQSGDRFDNLPNGWLKREKNPWMKDSFSGPDPLENLKDSFTALCSAEKLGSSKKDAHASWGLFMALAESVDQLKEIRAQTAALEAENKELRAQRDSHACS